MRPGIMIIVGTRPEAIKMIPVIKELKAREDKFDLLVVNTGQHREMTDQVFSLFKIKPDIDLDIMASAPTNLAALTSVLTARLNSLFKKLSPNILLVEGDTSTVFTGALLAFYHKIPVGHIEAGLRTSDIYQPFPEEVNRRMVSVLSSFHFSPTWWAKENLLKEGIREDSVFITGNPVIDALLETARMPLEPTLDYLGFRNFGSSRVILVTAHRRENHGEPISNICKAIKELAHIYKDVVFIYPIHPHPKVWHPVHAALYGYTNIILTSPLYYYTFVYLMRRCYLILSDSGGIQEEAPTFRKPVLVLREKTERPEALEIGAIKLVGTNTERIIEETRKLLNDPEAYKRMQAPSNPFGDGRAAQRIVDILEKNF